MNSIDEIKDMLYAELDCIAEEGKMSASILDVIDKVTHSLKSISALEMIDDYGVEYSRRNNGRYDGGYSYAYARNGRSMRNDRRNSMRGDGSYRSGRYSRDDGEDRIIDMIEDYMNNTPSEKKRDAAKKLLDQMKDDD